MSKETVLFSSEERKDRQSAADFLRQLADRLAQGEVILRQGDQELVLHVPDQVVLELKAEEEAKRGGPKRKLEVEIEWSEGDQTSGEVSLG